MFSIYFSILRLLQIARLFQVWLFWADVYRFFGRSFIETYSFQGLSYAFPPFFAFFPFIGRTSPGETAKITHASDCKPRKKAAIPLVP